METRRSSGAVDLGVDLAGAEAGVAAVVVAGEVAGEEAGAEALAGVGKKKVKAETKAVDEIMQETRQHVDTPTHPCRTCATQNTIAQHNRLVTSFPIVSLASLVKKFGISFRQE